MHNVTINKTSNLNMIIQQSKQLLIEQLEQGDEAMRCYSAKAIALSGIIEAEPALNQCLYHEDPDVVVDASEALAALKIGDISALSDVARFHPEGDARLAALNALSHCLSQPEIERLFLELAQGRNDTDSWGISSDWDDWWDIQLYVVKVLVEQAKTEYATVFQSILEQDPEPELEALIYRGIAKLDPDWVIERLANAALMTRRKLLKGLQASQSRMATVFLFKHLVDEDSLCRRYAIESLGNRYAHEYFWDIAKRLQDTEFSVQQAAIIALEQLASAGEIDKSRLLSYLTTCPASAKALLIQLLSSQQIAAEDAKYVLEAINESEPEALIAALHILSNVPLAEVERLRVSELTNAALLNTSLASHHQIRLIRAIGLFDGLAQQLFDQLERRIVEVEHKSQQPRFDTSVRQACFDVISQIEKPASQHLMRMTLFGLQAYPSSIEVEQAALSVPPLSEPSPDAEEVLALLEQHQVPEQLEIDKPNLSTLDAITQSNLSAMLGVSAAPDDQQTTIVDMVNELDEEFDTFADVVKANFDSADNLNLNRRKIATLPEFDNKILALRSLGQSNHPQAAEWLIEALLDANEQELSEIFTALALQKKTNPKQPHADNAIGRAGRTLLDGHEVAQQCALQYLSQVSAAKSVPLAIEALASPSEHIRLNALFTIEAHLAKLNQKLKPIVHQAVKKALTDPSAGLRKQALKMACILREDDESISSLIELVLNDDECHPFAYHLLEPIQQQVLEAVNLRFADLTEQQKPNAIKLIGGVL